MSYKALLVCKKNFAYECEETGDIVYDGYTLLRMIYMVVKPNVVIDVKDLQLKIRSVCTRKLARLAKKVFFSA
jgi:hypothetical protein